MLNRNSFNSIDDLLLAVYNDLVKRPFDIEATRSKESGKMSEIIGCSLTLSNPLSRLSRSVVKGKAFSPIGELLWYLSGSDKLDFIKYYIRHYVDEVEEDGVTIHGAYGPRLFNMRGINQIESIKNLLSNRKSSRRAVIQLFSAEDLIGSFKDIPCTCTLQFLIRENKLNLSVYMRSNDAYMGLPHDIFTFTMIQEVMARELKVELGEYHHSVGSLHIYEKNLPDIESYIFEGYQSTQSPMPPMPDYDIWESISKLIEIESNTRNGQSFDVSSLHDYWADLSRLAYIHHLSKSKKTTDIANVMGDMNKVYHMYVEQKLERLNK